MYKINKKNIGLSFIFCFIFSALFVSLISPQIAGASIFQPGATLEPDCAPGSVNCGVAVFSLNGLTTTSQNLSVGAGGTDFTIVSSGGTHTFNLPSSSAVNRGLLSASDWSMFNAKQNALGFSPLNPANNLTDVASPNTALNTLLPLQTGNAGKVLSTDGSNTSWIATGGTGTVTSVTSANGDATVATTTTTPVITIVSAPKLTTARTINGVSFDGTSNITISASADAGTLTGTTLAANVVNSSLTSVGTLTNLTVTNPITGSVTGSSGSATGNAGTATALQTSRTINGVAFDGTSNITVAAAAGTLTGTTLAANVVNSSLTSVGTLANLTVTNPISGSVTGSSGSTTGNAGTATALQTSRTINGVAFDGTSNITVAAAAGTLTGTTLAANVVNSSLTSVGTLTDLTVANPISGSITGSSGSTTGNAGTATALQTSRTINGVSFNGTTNITVAAAAGTLTGTTLASGVLDSSLTSVGTLTDLTVTNPITGSVTGSSGSTTGNAGTATALQTARTINGVSFNGTANINVAAAAGTLTGTTLSAGVTDSSLTTVGTLTDLTVTNPISGSVTGSSGSTTGNAATATALQTARTVNGVSFNGTANITVAAAAGTLTGTTLAAGVTSSSLTSVGTLGSLTLGGAVTGASSYNGLVITANTGAITTGTWNGTNIAVANGGTGTSNGSITGTGALAFASNTTSAVSLDSGTTGAVNIGTGANAKTITIGNTTGATTLNLQSGTGNINLQVAGTGTTGNVQVGAGGGGTATPDLLVLDVKNTSGDPTGTNGAMYYNSNINTFRCFQNGAWANCINGDKYFLAKSTDQSVTSSTTLTSDTALTFAVGSGETWVFDYSLFVTNANSAQPDFKAAILGASGWTCSVQMSGDEPNGAAFQQATTTDCDNAPTAMVDSGIAADGGNGFNVHIQGTITTTSAGSVTLQFAQNTSSASAVTVKGGSSATAFKVGGADLAEMYYSNESFVPGTVVAIDPNLSIGVTKSSGVSDKNLLGVVTTQPGMVLGDNHTSSGVPVLVALAGRVPVNVSTENGPIQIGDYLTSSSIPGVAMRADNNNIVIGQSLSPYDGSVQGVVLMFVKNFKSNGAAEYFGDVAPKINVDGGDNSGIVAFISSITSEIVHDPIALISKKITDGKQFLTDFIAARVTAIRGYFDEVFTRKIHTEQICVKKTDGTEVCVGGDQMDLLLQNANITSGETPASGNTENDGSSAADNSALTPVETAPDATESGPESTAESAATETPADDTQIEAPETSTDAPAPAEESTSPESAP